MFHKSLEFSLLILLFLVVSIMAWSCKPKGTSKRLVTVSILPQKYLVEQLAGSLVDVHVMVPAGSSPESYDPTPQDMVEVSRSALYFAVGGLGFEQAWIPRMKDQNPTLRVIDTSAGLPHLYYEDDRDPHVWTSPGNMKWMASQVCDALVAEDSLHASVYRKNLELFDARMDSIHERMRQLFAIAPVRTFVIYHPALTYLAAEFHLQQIGVEREHKEPSPATMRDLVQEIKAGDAKVIFMQQEFDVRLVETLAAETGLRIVRINLLSDQWEYEMQRIALEMSK